MKRTSGHTGAHRRRQPRFVEALEDRRLLAAVLVKDINLTGAGSSPTAFVEYRGQVYFGARDVEHGAELWRTTAGGAGAELVVDSTPGPDSSGLEPVTVFKDRLILRTPGPVWPGQLWSTDGTAAGTIKLGDIGLDLTEPPVEIDGTLYMNADSAQKGGELWKTDGTPQGTVLVKDILPGPGISDPSGLTNVNGTLYFVANDGSQNHGAELWKSDGTAEGTMLVKDVRVGVSGSGPHELAAAGNLLLFTANDGLSGQKLWRSDGTEAGTVPVADAEAIGVSELTAVNGTVFFSGRAPDLRLWKSDGTTTTLLAAESPEEITRVGDRVFFQGYSAAAGSELWVSDGTTANTRMVADLAAGPGGSSLYHLTDVNGVLYFTAQDAIGFAVWTSDGTAAGTRLLRRIPNPGALDFTAASPSGPVYFHTDDAAIGREVWRTDGTPESTTLVRDINLGTLSSNPGGFPASGPGFYVHGGLAYFPASDGTTSSMWQTDGTADGTRPAPHIAPDIVGSLGDLLVMKRSDEQHGNELWVSDGTPQGTRLLKDLTPGPTGTFDDLEWFAFAGDKLFFIQRSHPLATENLWVTDGTPEGTIKLRTDSGFKLTTLGDRVVFGDTKLWISDGTVAGTKPISGTESNPQGPTVSAIYGVFNGAVYFSSRSPSGQGEDFWRTDGTAAGTEIWADTPAGGWTYPGMSEIEIARDRMYFIADDRVHGPELWVTDGTRAGTHLVKDVWPGPSGQPLGSQGSPHGRLGDLVFYRLSDGVNGAELWRSDGTEGGTFMLEDITPFGAPSSLHFFTPVNGTLYFTNFIDIWRTDGTVENTVRVTGPGTGSNIRRPEHLTEWNGGLLFAAESAATGIELFKIERPTADAGTSYTVAPGGVVTLDGTGSSDPDPAESLGYAWDLDGDGLFGEFDAGASRGIELGPEPEFSAEGLAEGTYVVTLRVTNGAGLTGEATAEVVVRAPQAGVQTVLGDETEADQWTVRYTQGNVQVFRRVGSSLVLEEEWPSVEVRELRFVGGGGDDSVSVFSTLPLTKVLLDGGDGNDTLLVTSDNDNGVGGSFERLEVYGGAAVLVKEDLGTSVVEVAEGSRLVLEAGAGVTLRTEQVVMDPLFGDRIDVGDNELVVEGGNAAAVEALIASARNGGTTRWQGPGIGTSAATTLTGLSAFDRGGEVVVKYTYNGDVNGDGRVNADDYFRIDAGFLAQPPDPIYLNGDFNFDGRVNADDYFLIDQAFLGQGAVLAGSGDSPAVASMAEADGDARRKVRRAAPVESVATRGRSSRRRAVRAD